MPHRFSEHPPILGDGALPYLMQCFKYEFAGDPRGYEESVGPESHRKIYLFRVARKSDRFYTNLLLQKRFV